MEFLRHPSIWLIACPAVHWAQELNLPPQIRPQARVPESVRASGWCWKVAERWGWRTWVCCSWFEENHIPVDYVAGTSMGGLVGGLYATGMSGEEISAFLKTINWNRSLRNELPYEARSFRRKEDKRDYPNDLEFGLKRGINFPSGFNSGHQVGLILDRIALPYSDLKTFDELPTPFRCVATDLVSGKAVVFSDGPLSEALACDHVPTRDLQPSSPRRSCLCRWRHR